jgi:FAD/FMN-containing dehydrogenase
MSTEISKLFERFGVEYAREPLFDYGKLYSSPAGYPVLTPSLDEVEEVVSRARDGGVPIRVRASGHTFSGASLPRESELLIRTDRLDHYRFEDPGTLTVGAGALVWDVRDLVRDHGFDLPVYNGGWAGPSLGGYINAGGFGKSGLSEVAGGLWENVEEIRLVDGEGKLRTLTCDDEAFRWIFGCYGQLGLVVEAKLNLIPLERGLRPDYPLGRSGAVPRRQEHDPKDNDRPPTGGRQTSLFWFTLLISPRQQQGAWRDLLELVQAHAGLVIPDGGWVGPILNGEPIGYRYVIRFRRFHPPLVYPNAETFLVVGVMAHLSSGDPDSNARILRLERDFIRLARQGGYRLYLQAENIGNRVDLRDYYGDEVFDAFIAWKRDMDPSSLFNRGVVSR